MVVPRTSEMDVCLEWKVVKGEIRKGREVGGQFLKSLKC